MGLINVPDRRIRKPIGMPQIDWDDPLNRGLVGYWGMFPYEFGGKVVHDLSGNGNVGTFNGTPTWQAGEFGSAIDFTAATDYIECGQNIGSGSQITIVAWVKPRALTDENVGSFRDVMVARWKNDTNDRGFQLRIDEQVGEDDATGEDLGFYVSSDGTNLDSSRYENFFTQGVWQQVVVTFDAGKVIAYKNGISVFTDTLTETSIYAASTDLAFGRAMNGGIWDYYNGLIDHILIYNRVLTASEIALLHRRPF